MDRRACTSLLVLISVLLALAGPLAAEMKQGRFAAGVGVADTTKLRRLMTMRLEDGVALELTVDVELHRRVLAGSSLNPSVLTPDRAACPQSCPARGRPYTGRGCKAIYQCSHTPTSQQLLK